MLSGGYLKVYLWSVIKISFIVWIIADVSDSKFPIVSYLSTSLLGIKHTNVQYCGPAWIHATIDYDVLHWLRCRSEWLIIQEGTIKAARLRWPLLQLYPLTTTRISYQELLPCRMNPNMVYYYWNWWRHSSYRPIYSALILLCIF